MLGKIDFANDKAIFRFIYFYLYPPLGMNPTEKDILDILNEFDTDYSGNIDFPEFCEMMRAQMKCENDQEMIRLAFRVLDRAGEGSIKSSSFKHLMMNIGLLYI